jgi:protein-tyrosine phosphatase
MRLQALDPEHYSGMEPIRILFVCLGNICRSPLAEGLMRDLAERRGLAGRFQFDSAGTGDWHLGHPPDHRSVAVAKARGLDIGHLRARRIEARDFSVFDLMLAMDRVNLRDLVKSAPAAGRADLHLFMDFAGRGVVDVPDPYQLDTAAFEQVFDMLQDGCASVLDRLVAMDRSASGKTSSVT